MTTLRVDYLVKYSDDIETIYYKIKGEHPKFDARESSVIVVSSGGPELLLMRGTFRSAVFVSDEQAVAEAENTATVNIDAPVNVDIRDISGVVSQQERLF